MLICCSLYYCIQNPNLHDEERGRGNYEDYVRFVNSLSGQKIKNTLSLDIRKLQIDGRMKLSILTS
ncbi:MAG: hypothetical protein GDA42_10735 [Ekhidna sp.]|nr:hypothetical protein [Ekhidna sp.]